MSAIVEQVRTDLRSPFVPQAVRLLAEADGYLEVVWPRLTTSVETAGFTGSALYMADMALDAVEQVYEPVMSPETLLAAGMTGDDLDQLAGVIDVFHYVQPQVLLVVAAMAEAYGRPRVGGHGKPDPRPLTAREQRHLALTMPSSPRTPLLDEVCETLGLAEAPDLYRAVASWPTYLSTAWEELQHLVAYPEFRRRGRGLYYYARSGARFLAEPLEADPTALRAAGLSEDAIAVAGQAIDTALPAVAMMMMHAEAMRVSLGIREREVVKVD